MDKVVFPVKELRNSHSAGERNCKIKCVNRNSTSNIQFSSGHTSKKSSITNAHPYCFFHAKVAEGRIVSNLATWCICCSFLLTWSPDFNDPLGNQTPSSRKFICVVY